MQELSVRFHSEEKIGDAIFRMFQDSAAIPSVNRRLDSFQPLIVFFFPPRSETILYLLWFDTRMALIVVLLMPANFVLAWIYANSLRTGFIAERETTAQATTRIEETLASIRTVKAFGTETREGGKLRRDNWDAFLAGRRARLMLAPVPASLPIRFAVSLTLRRCTSVRTEVLAGGTAGFGHAAVSLGLFQGSLWLVSNVSKRTRNITDHWGSMQDVVVAISRVLEMLGQAPEQSVRSGHAIPAEDCDRPGAGGCDLRLRTPRTTSPRRRQSRSAVLVRLLQSPGPSGSGKSTIISLIVRFFDPIAGRILLDGEPIDSFELFRVARDACPSRLQENPLFTATIRDNVAYGRPNASTAEVLAAIQRAGLGDFVRSFAGRPRHDARRKRGRNFPFGQGSADRPRARDSSRRPRFFCSTNPLRRSTWATEQSVMRGLARVGRRGRPETRMVILATQSPDDGISRRPNLSACRGPTRCRRRISA